jgi:hypothetical protein
VSETLFGYDLEAISIALRNGLRDIVERLGRRAVRDADGNVTSVIRPQVVWRDERQPFVNPTTGTIVKLSLQGRKIHGTPEQRITEDLDAEGAEIKVDVFTHKAVTLRVLIESFDQKGQAADLLAERIRGRFYRPWTHAELSALNCSVIRVEDSQNLPKTYDKHVWSVAAFDVRLNAASIDLQDEWDGELLEGESTDATTYIETVTTSAPIEPPPFDAIASDNVTTIPQPSA